MQLFIPAVETWPVSSSPQQHIPKSANGEGVKHSKQQRKSSTTDEWLFFHCKWPGHLKKDCPELPYCSKCRTRGHIPVKCPSKQQANRSAHKRCELWEEERSQENENHREQWKKAHDLPQFSHRNNRCLHCIGDHQHHDCPTRWQHQAPTTRNPDSGTGIYTYHNPQSSISPQLSAHSQSDSQHSQSTVHVTTPTLMVNSGPFQQGLQQWPRAPVSQINQQTNYHTRPQQFNRNPLPQFSPLLTPPQQFNMHIPQPFNPQVTPPTFHSIHLLTAHLWVVMTLLF